MPHSGFDPFDAIAHPSPEPLPSKTTPNAMKRLLACTCCLVLGTISLSAKERMAKCRLLSVAPSGGPTEVFLAHGRGARPLRLVPSASIDTAAVEIPVGDDGSLQFSAGKKADDDQSASLSVPAGAEEILIFVLPGDDGLRLALADFQPEALAKGGVYLYNAGSSEARLTVGEKTLSVAASEGAVIGDPGPKDPFNMVATKIEVNDGTRWRSLKDGASSFAGKVSYWMVVFEAPKANRPQLRIYKRR